MLARRTSGIFLVAMLGLMSAPADAETIKIVMEKIGFAPGAYRDGDQRRLECGHRAKKDRTAGPQKGRRRRLFLQIPPQHEGADGHRAVMSGRAERQYQP